VLAIYSPNLPEYALAAYGAMAAGGVVAPANPLLTADELTGQLADAGARLLVTVPPLLDKACAAAEKAGVDEVLVFGGGEEGEPPGVTALSSLMDGDHPAVVVEPAGDLAALLYSSGTTGMPKGVELTHASLVTNARQNQAGLEIGEDDVVLVALPLFHAMGLNLLLPSSLAAGATAVILPRFELSGFLSAIERHRVTGTIVVPPIMLALAHHPLVDHYDHSSLRLVGCGGAPLGAELERRCAERLGCVVAQGFGMTEGSSTIAVGPVSAPRRGSMGRLLPNVEARIVDPVTSADLGPGATGELWVRGPQLMRGYRHQPEATARTVDAAGWLHTGDLCMFDEDGYLYVVDRLKELIKYKGYQVAPAELEHLLLTHPAVADAAVVPRPDPESGEIPVAYVVLRTDATPGELMAHVAEKVAPYKRIRAVRLTTEVPRSPAGKLLRRVLVERERTSVAQRPAGDPPPRNGDPPPPNAFDLGGRGGSGLPPHGSGNPAAPGNPLTPGNPVIPGRRNAFDLGGAWGERAPPTWIGLRLVNRRTVDLSGFPDLVVIYLGMRANRPRGIWTLLRLGPRIATAVGERPDGLLLHETLLFSAFPPHLAMRQYWRDFDSLERWTRSLPHREWWGSFVRDARGTGFWHETYCMRGGMEAIFGDMAVPVGLMRVAPPVAAHGPMLSARGRIG
jgi:acyl-CoA synthetase (AMP-forming)/AMP-acid ligase II